MVKSMSVKNLAQSLWRGFCNLPLPLPGLRMGLACGVLGLVYARRTVRLGDVATRLLRVLEYRGYDSTGGVFQDGERITLLKAPGAPSEICAALGMPSQEGTVFCGQVRWATFGAVDELNAQPHVMSCKRPIYGAHNGNISNSPQLKEWLLERGHRILSDNDGEMLVHLIEDHFDSELGKGVHESPEAAMPPARLRAPTRLWWCFRKRAPAGPSRPAQAFMPVWAWRRTRGRTPSSWHPATLPPCSAARA
jgi:hypothetical protein